MINCLFVIVLPFRAAHVVLPMSFLEITNLAHGHHLHFIDSLLSPEIAYVVIRKIKV